MLANLINYFLVLSISWILILTILLFRKPHRSISLNIFIYLNILLILDVFFTLILLNAGSIENINLAARARLVAEVFLPAVLFQFTRSFSFSGTLPRFSFSNILVFLPALGLSVMAINGQMIQGYSVSDGINFIQFSKYYWIFIAYVNSVFYLIFRDIISKYRQSRRQEEVNFFKEISLIIFPITFIAFSAIYQMPFFNLFHPVLLSGYFIFAGTVFIGSLRYQIIEPDEFTHQIFLQTAVTSVFLLIFFIFLPLQTDLGTAILVIPAFLALVFLGLYLSDYLANAFKIFHSGFSDELDKKLEEFSRQLISFIDEQELWNFVAKFCRETFSITKIAIIASRYDISPYQTVFIDEFREEEISQLLTQNQSPILETLEVDRQIVNKFNYPMDSVLYQLMDRSNIYLAVPFSLHQNLFGFILLGGNRRHTRIPQRQLQILKLMSSQIAIVLQKIETIQKTVQAQKMAELGTLASQLAHDFQSFITIVKLETSENDRLKRHANYMEKLVQDLLNYARPQELRISSVNINHLIDMSLDLVEIPSNIVVEKHYSESIPEMRLDIGQIRRVFTNLFENSIRAMQNNVNGGRFKITTRPLRPISKVQRNPWIYIEILDEGEGIQEEFLERIFDPFFTTNKEKGGNGMGLAIVKQIISRHRGHIDVTSKPGKGTIFNIRLPYII